MFIDNPKDYSIRQFSLVGDDSANKKRVKDKIAYYEDKDRINTTVRQKINQLSVAKVPLILSVSGKKDTPLRVSVKTPATTFVVHSEIVLSQKDSTSTAGLNHRIC